MHKILATANQRGRILPNERDGSALPIWSAINSKGRTSRPALVPFPFPLSNTNFELRDSFHRKTSRNLLALPPLRVPSEIMSEGPSSQASLRPSGPPAPKPQWERHMLEIRRLYIVENLNLKEVQERMADKITAT